MSMSPRSRACMFSSVTSSARPSKTGRIVAFTASKACPMGTSSQRMPRFAARAKESSTLPRDEYGLGIVSPRTFSGPSASAAMAAVTAESMPPLRPRQTVENPHFVT